MPVIRLENERKKQILKELRLTKTHFMVVFSFTLSLFLYTDALSWHLYNMARFYDYNCIIGIRYKIRGFLHMTS